MLRRRELMKSPYEVGIGISMSDADANIHSRKGNSGGTRALCRSSPPSPVSPRGISALGFPTQQ